MRSPLHSRAVGVGIGLVIGALLAAAFGSALARAGAPRQAPAQIQPVAPGLVSYQGFLSAAGGQPFSGSAAMRFAVYAAPSGGSPLWEESQATVSVGDGFFSATLGSVTPLEAALFAGPDRYLEVAVDTGGGFTTLPRQRLAAVPYALQAEAAASVPWDGITDVPAGLGAGYEHVIVVAKSGGDFSSAAAALASISDASPSNRYLVWVAPGEYSESELLVVGGYVHLRGAGPTTTILSSARGAATPSEQAATARLDDNGRISHLAIRNSGGATYGIGVWSAAATRSAVIADAVVEAVGAGGTGHYAVLLSDSEPTISRSTLRARGATGFGTAVNAALGASNVVGGFPQPLIEDSLLLAGNVDPDGKSCAGNTGTGFGMQLINAAPTVRGSQICGDHRAIFAGTNGIVRVQHSQFEVSSTGQAFLVETTNAAAVLFAGSGVFYVGNKHTGTGGLGCVHSYTSSYSAASDGNTPATACN